jgi:ParB family chromosome partitioning protein
MKTKGTMIRTIELSRIDASNRLRPVNPTWVQAMAEQVLSGDTLPPIDVVERGTGFRLIAGGHRVEAHKRAGRATIEATVWPAEAFASEAALRLHEIKENIVRYELTELDRAVHLAAWKDIHEAAAGPGKKGGRPKKGEAEKPVPDLAEVFAGSFTEAAAAALKVSQRSVYRSVQIANGLDPAVRERISFHPIADNLSELLQLAGETRDLQVRVVNLLLSEPPEAQTVADAVAVLQGQQKPQRPEPWVKVSSTFSRLKEAEQNAFFTAHSDAIDRWLATRRR